DGRRRLRRARFGTQHTGRARPRRERRRLERRCMSRILSLTTLAETLRIAAPYACAAIGGVWAERSGVIQIGLEGVLLVSAFGSIAAAVATGSMIASVAAGVLAAVALCAAHAAVVDKTRIDAVVAGIGWNFLP